MINKTNTQIIITSGLFFRKSVRLSEDPHILFIRLISAGLCGVGIRAVA